jgi:thiamine pyrophosphokinase
MGTTRAFIFANGTVTDLEAVRAMLEEDDYLIAADGGLRHIVALGLRPQLLIGDLDSVEAADLADMEAAGVEIRRFPAEKDETDLELALRSLTGQGFETIRVVGALGGRLDQTLANVALLDLAGLEEADVRLDDGREEILIIRTRTIVNGTAGDTLSLLAMDGCTKGIGTYGLKHPLKNGTLCPNQSRGISNVMVGDHCEIRLRSGRLLCIHTRQEPVNGN